MAAIINPFPGLSDDFRAGAVGGGADDGEGYTVAGHAGVGTTVVRRGRGIKTPIGAALDGFIGRANHCERTRLGRINGEKHGALLNHSHGRHGDSDGISAGADGAARGRILAAAKGGRGRDCADETVRELAHIRDVANASVGHQDSLRTHAGAVDHLRLRLRLESIHHQKGG